MENTCACIRQVRGERKSSVEEQIKQSKVHWSLLSLESRGSKEGEDKEVAEVSNVRVFKDLQAYPSWGGFFHTADVFSKFVVGKKFAAGAQAELYHVQLMGRNAK
jgi:hypothetical protein